MNRTLPEFADGRKYEREFGDKLIVKDNVFPPACGHMSSARDVRGELIVQLAYNTGNLVPDREFATLPDLHNDTETSSPHDLTELNRRGVGPLAVVQPRPHGGVERNPCHLDQDLTRSDLQITGRLCLAFERGRSDVLRGAFVEDVLLVGRGQGHGEGSLMIFANHEIRSEPLFHPVCRLQTKTFTFPLPGPHDSSALRSPGDAFLLAPGRRFQCLHFERSSFICDYSVHNIVSRSAQVRIRILKEATKNINHYILERGVLYHQGEGVEQE
jgi:hypothetical protein